LPLTRKPSAVEIKGVGSDIHVILNSESPFSEIERELIRKFEKSRHILSGAYIVLDAKERGLTEEECQRIDMILNTIFDLSISLIRTESDETRKSAESVGWNTKEPVDELIRVTGDENSTVIVRHTIRAGQSESYPGNVVIIGDVNPSGVIEAGGDIIVFGALRGIAHAGMSGNISATITAIELRPLQLRIAGIYARSPDNYSEDESFPEVARLKDGKIIVESLNKYKRGD